MIAEREKKVRLDRINDLMLTCVLPILDRDQEASVGLALGLQPMAHFQILNAKRFARLPYSQLALHLLARKRHRLGL